MISLVNVQKYYQLCVLCVATAVNVHTYYLLHVVKVIFYTKV